MIVPYQVNSFKPCFKLKAKIYSGMTTIEWILPGMTVIEYEVYTIPFG